MAYRVVFSKRANKDGQKIKNAGLVSKVKKIIEIVQENPYQPPYEKLIGDLNGLYSRRINITHRFVYEVLEEDKIVRVLAMWTHYE